MRPLVLVAVVSAIALAACETASPPARSPAARPGQPTPSPSGIEIKPGTYVDPVVVSFCVTEERIIGMEARIITDRFNVRGAQRAFRRAAREAAGQVPILEQGDRPEAAQTVRRWVAALERGPELIARGRDGYEALKPAIAALDRVDDALSCELDLDDPVPETDDE